MKDYTNPTNQLYDEGSAPVMVTLTNGSEERLTLAKSWSGGTYLTDDVSDSEAGQACAFSPCGRYLAAGFGYSALDTDCLRVYERKGHAPSTYVQMFATNPASTNVTSAAWSPDGLFLAVGLFGSPYVKIYTRDAATFTALSNPASLPTGAASKVAWSPEGRFLAVAHSTSPYVTIYERSGTTFTKLSNPASLPAGNATDVAWSPDGRFLSVVHATSPYLTIYERTDTTFTKLSNPSTLPPSGSVGCTFSPDGLILAVTGANSPQLVLYQRSGSTFTKLSDPASLPPGSQCACWAPDGRTLVIGTTTTPYLSVYSWNGATLTATSAPSSAPVDWVNCADVAPDGHALAVSVSTGAGANLIVYTSDGSVPEGPPTTIQIAD